MAADGETEAFYRIAHSPSISPTGARVAYSTLDGSLYEGAGFAYGSYTIETSALDGSGRMTLTEGDVMDFAPAWSPNGPQIAFVRRYDRGGSDRICGSFRRLGIFTVRDGGHDIRKVVDIPSRSGEGTPGEGTPEEWHAWYHSGPVWSSDGQLLAYVVTETEEAAGEERPGYFTRYYSRTHTALYTVNADGSDLKRLLTFSNRGKRSTSDQTYVTTDEELRSTGLFSAEPFRSIVSPPAWSSDRQHIAFVGVSEGVPTLYTVGSNGSDLQEVVALESPVVANSSELWRWISGILRQTSSTVFWSRDDSQVLFSWDGRLYFVNADGSDLHSIDGGDYASPSPDGLRVAHLIEPWSEAVLYTMAPDGSDARALASAGEDFVLQRVGPELRPSADIPSCSAGVVVLDPEANPGLVRDCEALVEIMDEIAAAGLNWDADTPIAEWEGVSLSPGRVRGLSLPGRGLTGPFPFEATELSALQELDLSSNTLSGVIPPELGRLTSLRVLKLNNNALRGPLPGEMGLLAELRTLDLGRNNLSGVIPPELGDLTELEGLDLWRNRLSGVIPPELGGLAELEELDLSENGLRGVIPSELGSLAKLEKLYLNRNILSGHVPSELGTLAALERLILSSNDLSGPIPPELGNLTALERLSLSNNDLSGSIPPELGNLTALKILELNFNYDLSGCIPATLNEQGINYREVGFEYCD